MRAVLVDAGPLVALLDRGDAHHAECVAAARAITATLLTVWPAFTEAMYLLSGTWPAQRALWEMIEAGAVGLAGLDANDAPAMKTLMQKYRDQPMDLADAALVRAAQRDRITTIFTLDRRHFRTYRTGSGKPFSMIP